jgi:hypothetical protein
MFSFREFQAAVIADNGAYERVYGRLGWVGRRSRLHDLVELLKRPGLPDTAAVRTAVTRVPADAWGKYTRTKAYLAKQCALAGFELPPGQPAVLGRDVEYRDGTPVVGYGPRPVDRARVTGIVVRPDTRLCWSIEVRYRLAAGVDPGEYAPFRQSKDELAYRLGRPTPSMGAVATTAWGRAWQPDGPVHYNVKRDAHTICIHDGPGPDKANAFLITNNPAAYPIRMCDIFRVSLFKVKPDVNLQADFERADFRDCLGEELAGSQVAFSFNLWRDSRDTPPQGNFMNQR